MRHTMNTTALLAAAALGAAAAYIEIAAGALEEALGAGGAPATAAYHVAAGPVSIALQAAALGGGREGVPACAHLVVGVAIPDLGLLAVHRVSYAAPPRDRDGAGPAARLAGARLSASRSWWSAG
ncbi:hypothetical protein [Sorangium sp. So ce1024]|uniref:hypothetical protein n=1 Tax=Sorangium sp. So ce1024 TaxID=3133327 RepID=UPI003EFBBF03